MQFAIQLEKLWICQTFGKGRVVNFSKFTVYLCLWWKMNGARRRAISLNAIGIFGRVYWEAKFKNL